MVKGIHPLDTDQVHYSPTLRTKVISHWGVGMFRAQQLRHILHRWVSGHFSSEGYGKAAFVKGIQIVDENGKLDALNANKALIISSDFTKYTFADYDFDKYGIHTYYGGPANFV